MRSLLVFVFCLGSLLVTRHAHADGYYGVNPESAPSVFTYGFRGLGLGAIDGLAVGYLVVRSGGLHGSDGETLLISTGIGAISGVALGLGLGLYDLMDDNPGVGAITLRDMFYGAALGAVTGLIVGGLVAISTDDAEPVAFGAALGALIGSGVGLVFGIIEGRRILDSPRHRRSAMRLSPFLAAAPDRDGRLGVSLGLRAEL